MLPVHPAPTPTSRRGTRASLLPQVKHKDKQIHPTETIQAFYQLIYDSGINGEGNGTPLQYSCLENPMDGEAWWAAIYGVAQSRTGLSDFTFTFHFHALGKETATHSSILAWRIPGTGEPGVLPSVGLHD